MFLRLFFCGFEIGYHQNWWTENCKSFVFHSTKDLQKMPLGKLSFFAYVISQKRIANHQNQLQNDVFHVKSIQSAKN